MLARAFRLLLEDLPLNESGTPDWNPLLDDPRSWKTGSQGDKSKNTVCPGRTEVIEECIQGEAVDSTAEAATGEDDAICQATLSAEVLRGDRRDDLLMSDVVNHQPGYHSPKNTSWKTSQYYRWSGWDRKQPYLMPNPIIKPLVAKSAPTFLTAKLLRISLSPIKAIPSKPTLRGPKRRMTRELMMAIAEIRAAANDPTKESTAGVARPSSTRALWMTPQEYDVPMIHHAMTKQPVTTTQP